MDNIDISFVIPAYNCAEYIEEAVFSIINLGLDNYEIVVVDDSSTDNTVEVLKKMQVDAMRILCSAKNGVSAARNTGIKNARGRFISFMDGDDECLKKSFKTAYNLLLNKDIDGIYIGIPEFCDSSMVPFKKQPKLNFNVQNKVYSLFASEIFATVQSLIIKREVFERVGYFSEDLDIAEDFDLYVRLFSACSIDVVNNQYGFRYRQNPNSLMNSKDSEDKLIRGSRFIVEKINSYDFNDKKLNKKREILASLKFLDLISNIARNGNKIGARKLLGEFCFSTPRINFKILKRVAKIITII